MHGQQNIKLYNTYLTAVNIDIMWPELYKIRE